jgi:hypothetical protein
VLLDGPHGDSGLLGAGSQLGGLLEPMRPSEREWLICGDGVKKVHLRARRSCERHTTLEGRIASICQARRYQDSVAVHRRFSSPNISNTVAKLAALKLLHSNDLCDREARAGISK